MKENPYSTIINAISKHGNNETPTIKIAKVVHVEETNTETLDVKIEVDDLTIDKDNIYISDYLLKEHVREFRTDAIAKPNVSSVTNLVNDGGHNASSHLHELETFSIADEKIYTRDTLKVDDLVAVMAVKGKQSYIILSRVVRLD